MNSQPSIGSTGRCAAEKIAIAVIIPSIIFGLLGFFAGFIVSRRCFKENKHRQNNFAAEENHKKVENPYSQEPAHKYVTTPPLQMSKVKIFHNPTKQCNLKVPNGSVEAIVESHKDNNVYV